MKRHKLISVVAALFFTVIIVIALFFTPKFKINSDILALFPNESGALPPSLVAEQIAQDKISDYISNRLFVLVSAPTFTQALQSAEQLSELLLPEKVVEFVELERDATKISELLALYRENNTGFYTQNNLDAITTNPDRFIQKEVRRRYMSPAGMGSENFVKDPFSVAEAFIRQASASQKTHLTLTDGVLALEKQGRHFVFLQVTLADSAFSVSVQEALMQLLDSSTDALFASNPSVEVLSSGVVRFAAAGAEQGKAEISTVGLGSLVGIIILLLLVFRSGSLLLLSTVPIMMGVVTGVVVCQFVFGQLHLIALVFGASLIGVSIDYTFHFLITRLKMSSETAGWSAQLGVKRLFNGLTLGLVTSASAYASFVFSGFPGFQQIALFSSVGLLAAYLTVLGLFPLVLHKPHNGEAHKRLFAWADSYLAQYQRLMKPRAMVTIVVGLLGVLVFGVSQLTTNDDIRLMQTPAAHLLEENKKFQSLTGQQTTHQFFLVSGKSAEQMLQRLESLHAVLAKEGLQAQSIAQWLPSMASQKQSQAVVEQHLLNTGRLTGFIKRLNVSPQVQQSILADQANKLQKTLNFQQAETVLMQSLDYPAYFTENDHYYGLMLLNTAPNPEALAALAADTQGVEWIDRVVKTNQLLLAFREQSSRLIMIAVAGILLFLSMRYGLFGALQVVLPPVLSIGMTLAVFGSLAIAINVFNIMALLLVLGIGIDYSLFLRESREHATETVVAISLSAITTLLSFGLLALSKTQAIQSFGLTILIGITCCFVFSPLVLHSLKNMRRIKP